MADHTYIPTDYKCCKVCGQTKQCSEFPRSLKHKQGCRSECKVCKSVKAGHVPRPVLEAAPDGMKRCSRCGKLFPATRDYFKWQAKYGLVNPCKTCIDFTTKAHKNTEQYKQWYASYYGSDSYKEKDKKRKQSTKYKTQMQQRQSSAGQRNYRRIWIATRRANTKKLPNDFTATDWQICLDYWHGCCAYCGRQRGLWQTDLAQDHFIPASSGGGYTPNNIVPACNGIDGCNQSKNKSDPYDWMARKFGKRRAKQIALRIEAYFAAVQK